MRDKLDRYYNNEELAKQLVARWPRLWMPGMRSLHPLMGPARVVSVEPDGDHWVYTEGRLTSGFRIEEDGCIPDLDDPSTRGCFLALVREFWPGTYVVPHKIQGEWIAIMPAGPWPSPGKTEGEALAYALLSLSKEKE